MKRRFKPKQWARPRSRRWREEQAGGVPGGLVMAAEILKDIYHDGRRRPAWARLAKKHGWMTSTEYYALDPTEEAPSLIDWLYRESPMFGMLKKDASFGSAA
jgi:hypothetical protein